MMTKTLSNTNVRDARKATSDLQVVGDGNLWRLLCKASSEKEGWMKSTKVMEIWHDYGTARIVTGCLVQVTTQQGDHVAEALAYIPDVKIALCGMKLESTS